MAWAPDYATLEQARGYERIGDAGDDVELALAITAASRAIDTAAGRQFGKADTVQQRYYTARWSLSLSRWVVPIDDVHDPGDMDVDFDSGGNGGYASAITSYQLRPRNNPLAGAPYSELVVMPWNAVTPTAALDGIRVTSSGFGWAAVPDTIVAATLIQTSRFHARRDSPYGIAGSPDQGGELRLLAKVDPDVRLMVSRYIRWWGAS